jgi:starch synthase
MVSSEAAPYARTGGLSDVLGSLPAALERAGAGVAVVIPRYGFIDVKDLRRVYDLPPVWLGGKPFAVAVFQAPAPFPFYVVDCPPLYDRVGLYGEGGVDYPDNHIRFAILARAAIAIARFLFRTDIFHCHDWQAGLLPAYLRSTFAADPTFFGTRTLFTIHNLGYQGLFPITALAEVGLDQSVAGPDGMEFFGQISYLKAGICFADALTTVSPTYAREIQTPELGFGLDDRLRARASRLTGILNGVDYSLWNPETDPYIPAPYSREDLSGKRICKQELIREFGLPDRAMDRPLAGIVSRFTAQKGTDILVDAAGEIAAQDMYLAALGNGEAPEEKLMLDLAAAYPDRVAVRIGFDEGLAHRVEAGADLFLMPSRYEPCGLNQMYSLRYGTVPVVRATGGLNDTIGEATGFKFEEYSGEALAGAIRAAALTYAEPGAWRSLMDHGMREDYSWDASAAAYLALYGRLLAAR